MVRPRRPPQGAALSPSARLRLAWWRSPVLRDVVRVVLLPLTLPLIILLGVPLAFAKKRRRSSPPAPAPRPSEALRQLLVSTEAPPSQRAEALGILAERGAPPEAMLEWLDGPTELCRVALEHLRGVHWHLTPAGLSWLLERHAPDALTAPLLPSAFEGWHPEMARYVRGRLASPDVYTQASAIEVLRMCDDDAEALIAYLSCARVVYRADAEYAIRCISRRRGGARGGLAVAQGEAGLSVVDEAGALSEP